MTTKTVKTVTPDNSAGGPGQPREAIYLPDGDLVLFAATKDSYAIVYDVMGSRFRLLKLANPLGTKQHSYGLMYDPKRNLAWVVHCGMGGGCRPGG